MSVNMWWMISLAAVSTLVILVVLGRRNERAVRKDWSVMLTPRGEQLYRSIEDQVRGEHELADLAIGEAVTVRQLGSAEEAIRLLEVGYKVLERFTPSMLQLLGAMATFSRMVSAVAPTPPLRPRAFRMTELASLALLNQSLHQLLVSTAERFRLRLYILGHSFGLLSRALYRSLRRLLLREPQEARQWAQVEAIRHDLGTLTGDSLDSLRALVSSFTAQERERILAQLRQGR
jgi:hypothetical protein